MKSIRLMFVAMALLLAGTSTAFARDSFGFSINIGSPGFYGPPPAVYYTPPPVYYHPAPIYYRSYGPRVYYKHYEPRRNHGHGHRGHHRGWNKHRGGHHR